jgi:hypothetical protein
MVNMAPRSSSVGIATYYVLATSDATAGKLANMPLNLTGAGAT